MTTATQSHQRILHIAPTPFFADRGCHIRIEGIVRSLNELGHGNIVCTYHHGRDVKGVQTRRITAIKRYTQTEAGPNPWKLWADLKLLFVCISTCKEQRPNVIHAHLHEGLFIGVLLKWCFFWRPITLIADLQGSFTGELDSHGVFKRLAFLKPVFRLAERLLMWFPDHIVCSSKRSLDLFIEDFNILSERISLAQDGADRAATLTQKEREELVRELDLPLNKTIAVYSGALLDAKGLKQLQQVIQDSADLAVHFLLIGYPTEAMASFLSTHTLQQNCSLLGKVPFEKLSKLLQLSDVAIDPKNFDAGEGSGKMLNYMACGLPVLAFDTANNRDFLPTGAVLASDVAEMITRLKQWVTDPAEREYVGQRNQEFFEQNYSWSVTVEQLRAVYAELKS